MNSSQSPYSSGFIFPERSTWHTHGASHSTKPNMTSSDSSAFLIDLDIALWRVVPPLLLVFGSLGNVMTVVVMRGMRASPSTACLSIYFTALAVSDQCGLLASVPFYWVREGFAWPESAFRFNLLCPIPKCVWNVTEITSAWFLVAMTYQRVTSVVAPHRVGVLCTVRRGKSIVAMIVFISIALNFHFLFTWSYSHEYGRCYYRKKYTYLVDYFEWEEMLCYVLLPYLLLIIGNSVLIWHVMKSLQMSTNMKGSTEQQTTSRKDKVYSMSVTLIVTSSAFLMFTLPSCFMNVYKRLKTTNSSDGYQAAVISLVWTFTLLCWFCVMSSNFYLYLLSGNKFRQEAKRYLCCGGQGPRSENSKLNQ